MFRSLVPFDELGENFFHLRVLLTLLVDNLLNELVLIAHILEVLTCSLRLNLGLEIVYSKMKKRFKNGDNL